MSAQQVCSVIDFQRFQGELDVAFHCKADPIPAGTTIYDELSAFIVKLHAHRMHHRATQKQASHAEAEHFLLPSVYDPRYRVNSSYVIDKARLSGCIRGIERKLPTTCHESGHEDQWTAAAIVQEYTSMLPIYRDFWNKKQLDGLKKIKEDRRTLPIASYEDDIVSAVKANQVAIVAGDTGCGKSTQVPQFLLNGFQRIVCTQPRRISAIALARRVSHETLQVHGSDIAYKVRFSGSMTSATRITFMTEGVLLRMLAGDSVLKQFDVVIVDEVHERHLNTDFLLALLRAVMIRRPEFRVVLMSATINFAAYSAYFGSCPVIKVPGRLYPITLEYVKHEEEVREADERGRDRGRGKKEKSKERFEESINPAPYLKLLKRIDGELPSSQRGDMLVFVSGMQDIDNLAAAIRPYAAESKQWLVLKLHSSLSVDEQDQVFDRAPEGVRKIIISTNIAETSVTIDGIRFVVDSGRAKEMVATGGISSLQEGWISKASADQRKGRAGRTGPGRCYRMYSERDFDGFRAFNLPEIQRIRIESLILQIKALAGSDMDPRSFGFLDPPSDEAMEVAVLKAKQAGALDQQELLTPLGAVISRLPLDINVGKLLILGSLLGLSSPILTIAAALSVQSPFSKIADDDERTKSARNELMDNEGDAFTLLRVFDEWAEVKATGKAREYEPLPLTSLLSQKQDQERGGTAKREERGKGNMINMSSRRWAKRAGIEEQRLYEMSKLRGQYGELMVDAGIVRLSGKRRGALKGVTLHAARGKLRDLHEERNRQRGRRVLKMGEEEEESEEEEEQGEQGGNLEELDLLVHVDIDQVHKDASRPLSRADVLLLKAVIACSFSPRVALPDPKNQQRRPQDCRFSTSTHPELVIHPGSSLAGDPTNLRPIDLISYYQLLETRRLYLCGLTPCPALPSLLLSSTEIDTNASCSRFVIDGWIMIRMLDDSGPKLIQWAVSLRTRLQTILSQRLKVSKDISCTGHAGDVYLFPWQAAASGCAPDVQSELASMPKDLRLSLVTLAAQSNHLNEAASATARWWGVGDLSPPEINEESLAEDLVLFMDSPVSHNIEKLQGGSKTTSLYRVPINTDPPSTERVHVPIDNRGVPRVKAGVLLTGYLQWASLQDYESQYTSHQLQPTMRRHWVCPGCSAKCIGTFDEIQQHLSICLRAKSLDKRDREEGGYDEGGDSRISLSANDSFDHHMSKGKCLQWGRRRVEVKERDLKDDREGIDTEDPPKNAALFHCEVCGIQCMMSPIQVLQHKSSCVR